MSWLYIFGLVVLVDKRHVERLGEILAEIVRRAALEGFAVLHHSLDGISVDSSGKPFVGRFDSFDY